MDLDGIKRFYEENMYGVWRDGENICYERLGRDPKETEVTDKPRNPFEVIGGELIRITVEKNGRKTSFTVHAFVPEDSKKKDYPKGFPFIICMHPIMPKDTALESGYAVFFMESYSIASDDIKHNGAFYDIYPYGTEASEQTGVLMAWSWGVSKVLDAVCSGLDGELFLDKNAAMVTGVSRWGKATAVCGAFDKRFRMTIPACSGAGGLALYNYFSKGNTYDLSSIGGPKEYTYGENEPLSCLQSDAERGWFNDAFLKYGKPEDIPMDQENLPVLAMDKDRYYFVIAACMSEDWVNAPSMWECYKRADRVYCENGLKDHLAVHFHREGHAVTEEDMQLIIAYFDRMYYGKENGLDREALKTTVFAGQEY